MGGWGGGTHEASRFLVPKPGIKSSPSAVGGQSLNHWNTREVPKQHFFWKVFTKVLSYQGSLLDFLTSLTVHMSKIALSTLYRNCWTPS